MSIIINLVLVFSSLSIFALDPIVIIAQGRSGSTFLSSWLGSHPNVTYFLEPCSMIYLKSFRRDATGISCANLMNKFLQCDFTDAAVERDQSVMIPQKAVGFKGWGHQGGVDDLVKCKERLTVGKELRFGQAWAEEKVSFSKVIVLFRDPRATRNSRNNDWPKPSKEKDWEANPLGWDGKRGFPYLQSLKSLCKEQLSLRERIAKHPEDPKVLAIEYTDVLKDPISLLSKVMAFAGLEPSENVLKHVQNSISGSCENEGKPFSVCRKLNSKRDDKWETQLPKELLDELMKIEECQEVVNRFYSNEKEDL
jgi:hypothetical protein